MSLAQIRTLMQYDRPIVSIERGHCATAQHQSAAPLCSAVVLPRRSDTSGRLGVALAMRRWASWLDQHRKNDSTFDPAD